MTTPAAGATIAHIAHIARIAPIAPIARNERSLAPDIARGFMLLFIALANVAHWTWGGPVNAYEYHADASAFDRVLLVAEQLLVHERSRPMFAILYGFGLAMMASRLTLRGVDVKGAKRVVRRRSWFLLAMGLAHSMLLFAGDILAPYGVTGLIVAAFIGRSDRTLRRWMWGSLIYVVAIGGPVFAVFFSGVLLPLESEASAPGFGATYLEAIGIGLAGTVITVGLASVFAIFVPLTLAGMLIFRAGWLQAPGKHLVALRRVFVSGMVVGVLTALPVALIASGAWSPTVGVHALTIWVTLVGGMYAGLAYVAGFALLAHAWRRRGRTGLPGALAALGARSLSGYLGQSIIMAPLLSAWGLRVGEGLGYASAYAIAVGVWLATLGIATWLDRTGRRGPFEIVLRRLTYRRSVKLALTS